MRLEIEAVGQIKFAVHASVHTIALGEQASKHARIHFYEIRSAGYADADTCEPVLTLWAAPIKSALGRLYFCSRSFAPRPSAIAH